jgi:CNT family concentrative nucleoside transporter
MTFLIDATIFAALTAYFIAIIIKSSDKKGFELFCLIYSFISLRLLARHVSMSRLIYDPIGRFFDAVMPSSENISKNKNFYAFGLLAFDAVLLLLSAIFFEMGPNTSLGSRLQSLAGVVVFIGISAATSRDFKAIPWHTVSVGILIQYFIALFVLKTNLGKKIFTYLSTFIADFLGFSLQGAFFIFNEYVPDSFAKNVLPAIVFFCSFIYIVYYFGGMQYIVGKMAWLFVRLMDTSGAESVVACASPFVGQGESALMVRPFVAHMTRSELHSTMTSGFATIAGSVLVFYLTMVRDPSTILTACVMSVPAGLLLSKMRYPEDEVSLTKGQITPTEAHEEEANFLHAATNGSATGMQLIILISGSLLSIVSLLAAANHVLGWSMGMLDFYDTVNPLKEDGTDRWITIQLALSYVFFPVAWLLGMPADECRLAGEVMASKMIANEFVAYSTLQELIATKAFSDRTADLMAFALCGFANFASIGIQIGALGAMAPKRTGDLAQLAFSAMIMGTVSTWLTAAIAGALM